MKNPWIQPIINALVISLLGAGALWFMRHQQPAPRAPEPVPAPHAQGEEPREDLTETERLASRPTPQTTTVTPQNISRPTEPISEPVEAPPPAAARAPATTVEPQPGAAEAAPAPPPPAAPTVAPQPGGNMATIRGVVQFRASPPRRSLIRMDADPKCAAMHADEPPLSEEVLVNDNGTLRNVFVYLKQAPPGHTYTPPRTPAVLDQVGCAYTPRVLGVQVRQPLLIRNSDDTLHNVHALARVNREFNIGQPNRGMESTRVFTQPEVMIRFKCDVHPWMSAYVGVLDHPFFAVTGEDGRFTITDIPPGTHTVVAWHEKFGTHEQTVTLTAGQATELQFAFGE